MDRRIAHAEPQLGFSARVNVGIAERRGDLADYRPMRSHLEGRAHPAEGGPTGRRVPAAVRDPADSRFGMSDDRAEPDAKSPGVECIGSPEGYDVEPVAYGQCLDALR